MITGADGKILYCIAVRKIGSIDTFDMSVTYLENHTVPELVVSLAHKWEQWSQWS